MKTAVAAPAPDPMQEIADLLDRWLWMRVTAELIAESDRLERRRRNREWWERERRTRRW